MQSYKGGLKIQLHFIVMCLMYAFQCPVFNSLPFLYFRGDLKCKIEGEWRECQEQDICSNNYEFEFTNKKGVESISMDYALICEKRLTEAMMMSIGFFGQFLAFLMAVLTEIPKCSKTLVLSGSVFLEGVMLLSTQYIRGSVLWIFLTLFVWNFVYSYLYSQIFAYTNDMYPLDIRDRAVNMLNIFWTSTALGYIIFAQVDGNWIHHVAFFSGLVVTVLSGLCYLLSSPPFPSPEEEYLLPSGKKVSIAQTLDTQQEKILAKEEQRNYMHDLVDKFKLLKQNKKYSKNALIFILTWAVFQLSYSTPFIAFNTLGGDIQQNVFISVLFDVGGSFITFYLLSKYDPLRLLLNNLLLIGIIQSLTYFVSPSSFFPQLIVILATKLSTRIGMTTLLTLLPFVLPYQFNQLVFNLANVLSILLSTLLPFYRYFMESHNMSIFCGIGILCTFALFLSAFFTTLDSENADIKAARVSRVKKSSFAPMKRNSDVVLESLIRRSSMISHQAALLVLDKHSVTEERKYLQVKHTELETIQEI